MDDDGLSNDIKELVSHEARKTATQILSLY